MVFLSCRTEATRRYYGTDSVLTAQAKSTGKAFAVVSGVLVEWPAGPVQRFYWNTHGWFNFHLIAPITLYYS